MDGRVKTLHPSIHGGLLARRDNAGDLDEMRTHGIAPIDLLVVNLYPFEQTVAKGAARDEIIENIDIGGPAMVRSAAKNHAAVAIVVDPSFYGQVVTAADPMSLARPESSLVSMPILSTAVSIAELIISTTITNIQLPIKSARSTAVVLRLHAAGMAAASMTSSSRRDSWVRNAALRPCME